MGSSRQARRLTQRSWPSGGGCWPGSSSSAPRPRTPARRSSSARSPSPTPSPTSCSSRCSPASCSAPCRGPRGSASSPSASPPCSSRTSDSRSSSSTTRTWSVTRSTSVGSSASCCSALPGSTPTAQTDVTHRRIHRCQPAGSWFSASPSPSLPACSSSRASAATRPTAS